MKTLNVELEDATLEKLRKAKDPKQWKQFLTEVADNYLREPKENLRNQRITVEEFKELCKQTSQVLEYVSNSTQQDVLLKIKPIIRKNVKEMGPAFEFFAGMDQDKFNEFLKSIGNSNNNSD